MEYRKAVKVILSAVALTFSANASALNFVTNGSFDAPDLDTNPVGIPQLARAQESKFKKAGPRFKLMTEINMSSWIPMEKTRIV